MGELDPYGAYRDDKPAAYLTANATSRSLATSCAIIGQGVFCWRKTTAVDQRSSRMKRNGRRRDPDMATERKGSGDEGSGIGWPCPVIRRPCRSTSYRSHVPLVLARPHLARPPVHARAPLGQRRPARRQSGPDRPDGPRTQAGAVPRRWSTSGSRRSRSGSRRPPRPTSTSSASSSTRACIPDDVDDPGARPVPGGADRAHLRVARRAPSGPSCTSTTRSRSCSGGSCSAWTRPASSTSP